MNHDDDEKLRESLRESFRPPPAQLARDLWPEMLREMDARRDRSLLDWALAALALGWMLAFPQAIPALLFHL